MSLASAVGALLVLAYINAHGAPQGSAFFDDVVQTITNAGVALVLAFVALSVGAWSVRQLWTEWLAWHPGRIEVDTFAAGSTLSDVDVAQLTMQFRQRLATLRLRAPTPVPGTAAESDFLEVLGRNGLDSKNILGSVLNVLRVAKPRHAWQINGVLVERDEWPRYGVTVQVIRLPSEGSPPETVWGRDWDESVRCAADRATAAILPRTRLCRTPWATWRRFVMPGELLEAYEDAVEHERGRCYDEALDAYYRASSRDPSNLALRLHVGQLQEKLGLYLDALSAYEGILAIHNEGSQGGRLPYRVAARSERRRTALVARYRRNLLLGGSELAEQWRKRAPRDKTQWNAREERRKELRDRLRPGLEQELAELDRDAGADAHALLAEPPPLDAALATVPQALAEERQVLRLRRALARAALQDLKSVRWRAWTYRRDGRLVLSPDSVELTELCIRQRLDFIEHKLSEEEPREEWRPGVKALDEKVRRIEGRRAFDRWQENYNAACAYAVPLMITPEPNGGLNSPDSWRGELAARAVERLTHAAACADSGYLAGRRDWLLSEDPDLDGLRRDPRFKWFEAMYFPAAAPTPDRPRHVQTLEISRYIRDLLVQTANRWECTWHDRGKKVDCRPDVHTLLEWWKDERRAWDLVREVAINHRHWSARLDLITKMQAWGDVHGFDALNVSFGRYEDDPMVGDVDAAHAATKAADARLRDMEKLLPGANGYPAGKQLREIARWQSTLRELDAEGRAPRQLIIAVLCDEHAALWQRFGEWVVAEAGDDEAERRSAFMRQMEEARQWWCRALQWWKTPALFKVIATRAMLGRRADPVV